MIGDMEQRERLRQRAQRRRLRRRRSGGRWRVERLHYSDQPLGPNLIGATPEEVMAALDELPDDFHWPEMAPAILPIFERVRPYPAGYPPRVETIVPPGLKISLALDIGPAFAHVTAEMLERWEVSLADLTAIALANVHDRAAQVQPADVYWGPVGDVQVGALQTGRSIGSTLVLAPSELARLFGRDPRLLIAPMRDVIFGLPPGEDELAAWLFHEIAAEDPNHLRPLLFAFDGQSVRVAAHGGVMA